MPAKVKKAVSERRLADLLNGTHAPLPEVWWLVLEVEERALPGHLERAARALETTLRAASDFLDLHYLGNAAIKERPSVGAVLGFVIEPKQNGRAIDTGKQPALSIEVEISCSVTGGTPHKVDAAIH